MLVSRFSIDPLTGNLHYFLKSLVNFRLEADILGSHILWIAKKPGLEPSMNESYDFWLYDTPELGFQKWDL